MKMEPSSKKSLEAYEEGISKKNPPLSEEKLCLYNKKFQSRELR